MAGLLEVEKAWELEIAAMLSQIGCVTVPEETLSKICMGEPIDPDEAKMYRAHPKIGSDLIANIPRLEPVAEIIAFQEKYFDGSGFPDDRKRGGALPLGARMLRLAIDYDALTASGQSRSDAVTAIRARQGLYDPKLVEVLEQVLATRARTDVRYIRIAELKPGMILAQDVRTMAGVLLTARGQEATPSLCGRLRNFARMGKGIAEPIKVQMPSEDDSSASVAA
jgi:response regulator RpfG family c-di-GMP phosphodiesterase